MLVETNSEPMPKAKAGDKQVGDRPKQEKVKALHVLVSEEAHLRARMAALASRIPFKTFMTQLMLSAAPIITERSAVISGEAALGEATSSQAAVHPVASGQVVPQPAAPIEDAVISPAPINTGIASTCTHHAPSGLHPSLVETAVCMSGRTSSGAATQNQHSS
jgi:hypothetical protein